MGFLRILVIVSLAMMWAGTPPADAQSEASSFPLQLAMRVPHEPTAFPSAGRMHVFYELYLTNFSSAPLDVRRIEVLDDSTDRATAVFEGKELGVRWQSVGIDSKAEELPAGGTAVVFLSVRFEPGAPMPTRLIHRLTTDTTTVQGAVIAVHHTSLVLGPPVRGADWLASDAPGLESHHWRQFLIVDGRIDHYRIESGSDETGPRTRELPLNDFVVDFGR